jgi:porin
MKRTQMIMAAILALLVSSPGFGQGKGALTEGTDATKAWMEERGISLESSYKGELWANVRGGVKQSQTHLHNIDIAAELGTTQAGLWSNGKFFVHVLSNQGGKLLTEEIVGDSQTVSNIEAPPSTRLYEFWYEHSLFDGKLSFLMGVHDLNSEFAVTEHGALFINSSFGISKDISSGARPSIFPLAAPAVRAKFSPNKSWEFLLGVYNGDPGDPGVYRHSPRFVFNDQGGAFIGFETAYRFGHGTSPGTIKAGYWNNTGSFDDLSQIDPNGNPAIRKGNQGFYLVAEKTILATDNGRNLAAFLQLGSAPNKNINEFTSYVGGGLKYAGLIPHRQQDEAGIAVAHAMVNNRLISDPGREKAETTLEITYRAVLNKSFALQPDVQFVFNPGADSTIKNAVIAGARFEISF